MTWNELKQSIDSELEKLEIDGTVEIWYFDFSYPEVARLSIDVSSKHGEGLSVSQ